MSEKRDSLICTIQPLAITALGTMEEEFIILGQLTYEMEVLLVTIVLLSHMGAEAEYSITAVH